MIQYQITVAFKYYIIEFVKVCQVKGLVRSGIFSQHNPYIFSVRRGIFSQHNPYILLTIFLITMFDV